MATVATMANAAADLQFMRSPCSEAPGQKRDAEGGSRGFPWLAPKWIAWGPWGGSAPT